MMTEKANWREMEAGRELDRVIAERLGWSEIEQRQLWFEDAYDDGWEQRLFGKRTGESVGDDPVPEYSTDANAALSLPLGEAEFFQLHVIPGGNTAARVYVPVSSRLSEAEPPFEISDTPALAICHAWLAYQDAKQ